MWPATTTMCHFDKFSVVYRRQIATARATATISTTTTALFLLMRAAFFRSETQFFFPNKLLTIHKSRGGDMLAELRVFWRFSDRFAIESELKRKKRVPHKLLVPFSWTTTTKNGEKNSNETQIESDFYSFQSQSELVRNAGVHLI